VERFGWFYGILQGRFLSRVCKTDSVSKLEDILPVIILYYLQCKPHIY
jgi:hypothetical protein